MHHDMKRKYLLLFTIYVSILITPECLKSQPRLVLNGGAGTAYMKLNSGIILVISNSNTNAITRNAGWIISEAENNRVKWNIGTSTGFEISFFFLERATLI